ncbi:MAG: DUF1656 domain-containing protein [Burkholderiaceae bacterium]|nr:DUF1656 domain-containing protein [Burkholderiaceae bacterium]
MPREFALGDIYCPTLLLIFLAALTVNWCLGWLLARFGLNRFVWHPPLFHLALFVCLFAAMALTVYR